MPASKFFPNLAFSRCLTSKNTSNKGTHLGLVGTTRV
jgi:hypothetical protein